MSPTAIDTLSTFGVGILCIVLGIIALAIFFKVLNWLGGRGTKPDSLSVRGVLKRIHGPLFTCRAGKRFKGCGSSGLRTQKTSRPTSPTSSTGWSS